MQLCVTSRRGDLNVRLHKAFIPSPAWVLAITKTLQVINPVYLFFNDRVAIVNLAQGSNSEILIYTTRCCSSCLQTRLFRLP